MPLLDRFGERSVLKRQRQALSMAAYRNRQDRRRSG
jgi:hypothetical protein